jgi:Protein of unknown function (DUF3717)
MYVALNQLTLADLETAINKARQALEHSSPKIGDDDPIQVDLSVLAGLYGKMIYYQQTSIPMELLSDTEQIALLTWAIH